MLIRRVVQPISRLLRGRLRWLPRWYEGLRSAPSIDDWSSPLLVARPPSAGMPGISASDLTAGVKSRLTPEVRTGQQRPPRLYTPRLDGSGMSTMRCLLVTSVLNVGGLEEVVATLARRLPEFGIHTAVLDVQSHPSSNGQPRGYLGQVLHDDGIEVHETDEAGADSWISCWRPDVLSAHGPLPGGVLASANHLSIPYIETLHGMHDLFGADWRAEAVRAAKISAIVSVSELVRLQYLTGNPGFPSARIVTVPNGVDDERRRGQDRARARERLGLRDEYLFVSLSRHCLQKNTYGLLTAFSDLARHHPGAHLVVAGKLVDPRYSRRVLRMRAGLPCRDRIHLRSHLADPASLLAAADGFVLNSFFEGWPLASMEALFAGLPVVISDVGGAREQMGSDPARGYLVSNPLGDSLRVDWESMRTARYRTQANRGELVTAMRRLVDDRQDYLSNRTFLAAESAARFSADTFLARHAAVLRAVISGADLPELVDAPSR
jgi:glycosyltransferase involved in cell wall biosynthesis